MRYAMSLCTIFAAALLLLPGSLRADDLKDDLFGRFHQKKVVADFGVWTRHYSAVSDLDPANFTRYSLYSTHYGGNFGLWSFSKTEGNPSIGANLTDSTLVVWSANWSLPPRVVSLHPYPDRYAVVRWKSTRPRTVEAQYTFYNVDSDCGDGVEWWVRRGTDTLDHGTLVNGGSTFPLSPAPIDLAAGESIDFVVGPGGAADHGCDATILDATIAPFGVTFFDNFSDGTAAGDPDWDELLGNWKVGSKKTFYSPSKGTAVALCNDIPLLSYQSGSVETRLKLTTRSRRRPNGALVFAWQDPAAYRYVRVVKKGRKAKIVIGQVGDIGTDLEGVKASKVRRLKSLRWNRLRADVQPTGVVVVYLNDNPTPVTMANFDAAAAGRVGYQTNRARAVFDEFTAYDHTLAP